MYKTIIKIENNLSSSVLNSIQDIVSNAFNNRAGKLVNISKNPYVFIFEGGDSDYGCLELGTISLRRERGFIECVHSWQWLDADPDENCDMLEVFERHAG